MYKIKFFLSMWRSQMLFEQYSCQPSKVHNLYTRTYICELSIAKTYAKGVSYERPGEARGKRVMGLRFLPKFLSKLIYFIKKNFDRQIHLNFSNLTYSQYNNTCRDPKLYEYLDTLDKASH